MRQPVKALMAGYSIPTLTSAATVTVGALANNALYRVVSGFIPVTFLKSGPGAALGKIGLSGITGAAVGLLRPQMASEIFFGGVLQAVMDLFNTYVTPNIPGLSGLADYLSVEDARRAQALGDYLSVEDARRAQALGTMPDEEGEVYIAEELAAIA
jgi:hypothetical protein